MFGHDKPNSVRREVERLHAKQLLWQVDTQNEVEAWIQGRHELAKSFTYSPQIVQDVTAEGELQPINLSLDYLQTAGEHARTRVLAAGLRIGAELKER